MSPRKWKKRYRMHHSWPIDLLVRVSIRLPENITHEGSRQCRRRHCKTCAHVRMGTDFTGAANGDKFSARVSATCKTSTIIYLTQCCKCKMQYVGETENPLHLRTNGHRSDYYRRLPDKPIARHFFQYTWPYIWGCNHNDYRTITLGWFNGTKV